LRIAVACLTLALSGCIQGAVDFSEVPEAPLAFLYRNLEETERMADELAAQQKAAQPQPDDEFEIHVEGLLRRGPDAVLRDQLGRVALYRVRTKSLEPLEGLVRGARPLGWSPDRTRLMFSSTHLGTSSLFEWLVETGEVRALTGGPAQQIDGCYGPNGELAWVQYESAGAYAGTRIWVRRPGEMPRAVTGGPIDSQPAWSPDGTRLVYTRIEGRNASLHWLEPNGEGRGSFGPGRSAAFSPDGSWIVYSARTSAGWQLRRMRADGSGKRAFGRSGFHENDPTFSPDGRFVVFSATQDEVSAVSRLFVRSWDDAKDRQLVFAGSGLLPAW
jgi:WD40 repeat protein